MVPFHLDPRSREIQEETTQYSTFFRTGHPECALFVLLCFVVLITICLTLFPRTQNTSSKQNNIKQYDYGTCPGLGKGDLVVDALGIYIYIAVLLVCWFSRSVLLVFGQVREQKRKERENQQNIDSVSCPDLRGHNTFLLGCLELLFVLYLFRPVCNSFCDQVRWCSSHPSPSTVSWRWFPLVGLVPYYILHNFNYNYTRGTLYIYQVEFIRKKLEIPKLLSSQMPTDLQSQFYCNSMLGLNTSPDHSQATKVVRVLPAGLIQAAVEAPAHCEALPFVQWRDATVGNHQQQGMVEFGIGMVTRGGSQGMQGMACSFGLSTLFGVEGEQKTTPLFGGPIKQLMHIPFWSTFGKVVKSPDQSYSALWVQ